MSLVAAPSRAETPDVELEVLSAQFEKKRLQVRLETLATQADILVAKLRKQKAAGSVVPPEQLEALRLLNAQIDDGIPKLDAAKDAAQAKLEALFAGGFQKDEVEPDPEPIEADRTTPSDAADPQMRPRMPKIPFESNNQGRTNFVFLERAAKWKLQSTELTGENRKLQPEVVVEWEINNPLPPGNYDVPLSARSRLENGQGRASVKSDGADPAALEFTWPARDENRRGIKLGSMNITDSTKVVSLHVFAMSPKATDSVALRNIILTPKD